ncbi:cysteine proteinase, partial [Artomyces pyxidatus]
ILQYPTSGTDRQVVTVRDLFMLSQDEFINDNIIGLCLKLCIADLQDEDPECIVDAHFFNTFFYTKLNNPRDGYQSVSRWTKDVNLFEKTYLVVPIHEECVLVLTMYSYLDCCQ